MEIFGVFGEVKRAEIVLDRRTGFPLDFGFVEFTRHIDAGLAMDCMHEVSLFVASCKAMLS